MCRNSKINTGFKKLPIINNIPRRLSKTASTMVHAGGEITWNVRAQMVSAARLSAGLTLGKNLTTPNQKNIAPILIRRIVLVLFLRFPGNISDSSFIFQL
nr:hypothetical protein [Echinicola marina]